MKKNLMIIMTTALLATGGISIVHAQAKNNIDFNTVPSMQSSFSTTNDNTMMDSNIPNSSAVNNNTYNDMIKIMQDNGFGAEATAMQNRDFTAMNKFMSNLSDADYNKMINIMKNNGYTGMANIMQSIGKQGMITMHQSMMGNYR
jgi:hypothetical protein